MSNEEMMNYCKNRIKTYTFHKLNLKGVTTKERFDECVAELISDINDDTQMLMDIEKTGSPVPKPVVQSFAGLSSYSDNVMEFYCRYKTLMNF
ncbi:MAG: hypothetical protein IKS93_03680 [Methanobrevibacter sp.]|nr:hypothetical protein [Methanobrevibacter sp.]